ncbi:MAG: ATP-binding cassette domain-containing protein [Deltaproteobacteria bacterium]|jgi:ABC-type multidrug transport system fused ATPase/permease subunit|nr:ATP-binding cassette domain-containing protein [Deltaproteobacteria bacterium]MBW2530929.1 ATP-binding cassette domain-containing protein [Deltaproteobacteria bacterium]
MKRSLSDWFAIGHPRYRVLLGQLLLVGTCGSALAYLDNYLLSALTDSLSAELGGAEAAASHSPGWISERLATVAGFICVSLPMAVLGAFVVARLVSAGIAFWRAQVVGRLQIKSKNDLESEILVHLLRKDDAFFSSHSPAETVNRLAVDIFRVSERRPATMTVWWSSLLIIGSLTFFLQRDWRLALIGLAACAGGAFWTYRITRNVSSYDRDFLSQDDKVKAQFEDFLRAAPEIQVGQLFPKVRARFVARQVGRSKLYQRYVGLRAMLKVANIVSALSAFAAMIGILLWIGSGGQGREALVLVPAVIWALPSLFENASELIYLNLDFQLAKTSMDRLLEYESPIEEESDAASAFETPEEASELVLDRVTYQYTGSDGTRQGGVQEVATSFAPGKWTAIVGGAGSGKSTVLKLLLGRFAPQNGAIRYDEQRLEKLGPARLAALLSLMPQSLALLNQSIRDNVLFGRGRGDADDLSEDDLAIVEEVGLGRVCRLKALEQSPDDAGLDDDVRGDIGAIRARVRRRLTDECGVTILPYEDRPFDPKQWLVESLVGGRCDRAQAVEALLGEKGDAKPLGPLADSTMPDRLAPFAREVLNESQNLLRLPNYALYAQLAPLPLDERLWRLRSTHLHLCDGDAPSPADRAALCAIALTAAPIECTGQDAEQLLARVGGKQARDDLALIEQTLGDGWERFEAAVVHPHLSWRDNLVFGVMEISNSRTGRLVDKTLLELLDEDALRPTFTRLGLDFGVGRQGGNLSGGQGQLVALCRTVLRRAPIVVLDEPTSALDPASRSRVAEFLQRWKKQRVVITVSHDPEFVRQADEIRLMEGGRLVASGTFDELLDESEPFRNIMRQS